MITKRPRGRSLPHAVRIAAVAIGMAACSQAGQPVSEAPTALAYADRVRGALSARNFGQAAEVARTAVIAYPTDPQLYLLAARSEAELGNAGSSAQAFVRSLELGLPDARREFGDAAFSSVRTDDAFSEVRRRLGAAASASARQTAQVSGERLAAGEVEIVDGPDGYVRAGDIVLHTSE